MKKHLNKIIFTAVIVAVLALVYWWGGNAPSLRGWNIEPESVQTNQQTVKKPDEALAKKPEEAVIPEKEAGQPAVEKTVEEKKDEYNTEPAPEGNPQPIEPQDAQISDKLFTCTLSVRCDTVLSNTDWLDEGKLEIVPKDGVIFAEKTVSFYEGESVFNLLLREMKRNKIHMEYEDTPIYNSAYIEGIGNLYEFDCGELSGWMYKVNGWFPNYGSSRYQLKDGDKVEWVYTCNLGEDIGGGYSSRNGK